MILLNDERIMNVPRGDKGERIVSLQGIHENILIDESRSQISNRSEFCFWARESVRDRLIQATESLPEGYQMLLKEAYRPLSTQKDAFQRSQEEYRKLFPEASEEKIYELTCQYVAPPNVAGHPTGGAVDVTLLYHGEEIDMGTEYNDEPVPPENLTWLYSDFITEEARANRQILIDAMEAAGFVNYPTEWWHWSYGDCYWAYFNGSSTLYTEKDEQEIL